METVNLTASFSAFVCILCTALNIFLVYGIRKIIDRYMDDQKVLNEDFFRRLDTYKELFKDE